jgi:hypothetical protein
MHKPSEVLPGAVFENRFSEKIQVSDVKAWDKVYYYFVGHSELFIGQKSNIIRLTFKSPYRRLIHGGYFGAGKYKENEKINGVNVYSVWGNMMKRCYVKSNPSYALYGAKGVTVCEDWHCYQVFASWYAKNMNYSIRKPQLDKDLLSGDKKIYSPETCAFLTGADNTLLANAKYYKVSISGSEFQYVHSLSEFARANNLCQSHLCCVANGKIKRSRKYKVVEINRSEYESNLA